MPGAHNSRLDDSHSLNEYTFSTFFEPRLVLFDFFLFWLQKWECVWFNWQYQFVKWLRLIFLFLIEYLRNAIYDWLIFVKFNSKHHVYKKALITQAFELWNQIKLSDAHMKTMSSSISQYSSSVLLCCAWHLPPMFYPFGHHFSWFYCSVFWLIYFLNFISKCHRKSKKSYYSA